MSKLKAYMVHDGEPNEVCILAFAASANQAKLVAFKTGWFEEYIRLRAIRKPDLDCCTKNKNEPWLAESNDDLPDGVTFFADYCGYDNSL